MSEAMNAPSDADAPELAAPVNRDGTVMLADIVGISRLYGIAGDLRAVEAIARCRNTLRDTVQAQGGRLVRTMGERIMALFPHGDAAALAAARMHIALEAMPPYDDVRLAMRIAFHTGVVIQREDEIFGETVDATTRMVAYAMTRQTLTYESTVRTLGPAVRISVQRFREAKESLAEPVWELAWRQSPDVTDVLGVPLALPLPPAVLRLTYRGQTIVRRRGNEAVRIGRDDRCDLLVADRKASRLHCTIERKLNAFVLRDHSTNGTYVTPQGERETVVLGEEIALTGSGIIVLGQSATEPTETIRYNCEPSAA